MKKILIPAFSVFIQFITSVQKIIIITLLFGENFWLTLDDFSNSILNKFIAAERIEFSLLIVIVYVAIHVLAGILWGFFILRLLKQIEEGKTRVNLDITGRKIDELSLEYLDKRKRWFQKSSGISILFLFAALFILVCGLVAVK